MKNIYCLEPEWPAPSNIRAYSTTRLKGCSPTPFEYFNLSYSVGDETSAVDKNLQLLESELSLPSSPKWLKQVHGVQALDAALINEPYPEADASYTTVPNIVCVVKTADCLPILICQCKGKEVAAIHAGWRGLLQGVIPGTLKKLQFPLKEYLAWIGPGISRQHFEINEQIQVDFLLRNPQNRDYFKIVEQRRYADLPGIARQQLQDAGVSAVYGGNHCTFSEANLFYSHRRDRGTTGRMASLIWITEDK